MSKVTFVLVDNDYIEYLKSIDHRVQDNYFGLDNHNQKPYVYGVEILCNQRKYLIPLTSPDKDKFEGKIFDEVYKKLTFKLIKKYPNSKKNRKPEFLGVLLLNNMIPLLDDKLITKINFHQCDEKYQRLLENQYRIITGSIDHITAMANNIYNYVVESENKFFIKMCCDFKALEDAAEKYIA